MRKSFFCFFTVVLCLFSLLCGCEKPAPYAENVSELRENIFSGAADDIAISEFYGFKETPYVNDGKVGAKVYALTFKLNIAPDEIKRSVKLQKDDRVYSADFATDAITSEYKAVMEIRLENIKEFSVDYICGSENQSIVFKSVLPENCLSYTQALQALYDKQRPLLDSFSADGKLNAELYMRIFVRKEKPYWYVGIASGNDRLKALLIDGTSGNLLAARDIF